MRQVHAFTALAVNSSQQDSAFVGGYTHCRLIRDNPHTPERRRCLQRCLFFFARSFAFRASLSRFLCSFCSAKNFWRAAIELMPSPSFSVLPAPLQSGHTVRYRHNSVADRICAASVGSWQPPENHESLIIHCRSILRKKPVVHFGIIFKAIVFCQNKGVDNDPRFFINNIN